MDKAIIEGAEPLGVTAHESHGVGRILLLHSVQLLSDDGISLVPADGLELALAPCTYPLHGCFEAVFTVDVLAVGRTLGAQCAVVAGEAGRTLDFDDLAVLDIGVDAALGAGGADIADGMADLDAGFGTGDLGL